MPEVYIIRGEGQDFAAPETGKEHDEDSQLEPMRDAENKGHFIIIQRTV